MVLELGEGEASDQRVAGVVPAALFRASVALADLVAVNPAVIASEHGRGELGDELVEYELSVHLASEGGNFLSLDLSLNQVDVGLDTGELSFHRKAVEISLSHLDHRVGVFDAEVDDLASVRGQGLEFFQGTEFVTLIQGDSARVGAGRVGESLLEVSDTLVDLREGGVGVGHLSAAMEGVGDEVRGGHMRSSYEGEEVLFQREGVVSTPFSEAAMWAFTEACRALS